MENNADKHLRDKLQGLQMPYDPAAWEQMEAMLDKKKKRRGFFWWWTGGIAAALLLTGGTYLLVQQAKQDSPTTTSQTALNNSTAPNNAAATGGAGSLQTNSEAPNTTTETANPTGRQKQEADYNTSAKKNNTAKQESTATNQRTTASTAHKQDRNNAYRKSNKTTSATNKQHVKQNPENSNENELLAATSTNANAVKEVTTLQQQTESVILPGISAQQNNEVAAASVTEEINTADSVAKEVAITAAAGTDSTNQPAANNANQQPKAARKSGFSYQLGIRTDLMATMAPLIMHAEKRFDTLSLVDKRGPAKFTVSAGLFNEFNFINRISIYMGVLYTRSTFQVNRPRVSESMNYADSIYRVYNSYTAQQHQIDIPIGLKVYPYVSSKVRFSVGFGIINHIKLKETFIAHTTQTPVANLSAALDVPFTYTTNNPFEVKSSTADMTTGVASSNQNEEAAYFGTNGYSRYYLSVYASLGAEFILAKKYSLLVEPLYYFAAQKMGEQNRRKHSVGLSLGVKYNFGTR